MIDSATELALLARGFNRQKNLPHTAEEFTTHC